MTDPYKQLREALEKATPGPWTCGTPFFDDEGYREIPMFASVRGTDVCPITICLPFPLVSGMQDANASFVSACRDLVPALLSSHDAQAAEIERLREALLWCGGALSAITERENDLIRTEGHTKTIGEILDQVNAALDLGEQP